MTYFWITIIKRTKRLKLKNKEFCVTGIHPFNFPLPSAQNRKKFVLQLIIKAVLFLKSKGKISNKEYQEICEVSKGTATKELKELTDKHSILKRKENVGAGTFYVIK